MGHGKRKDEDRDKRARRRKRKLATAAQRKIRGSGRPSVLVKVASGGKVKVRIKGGGKRTIKVSVKVTMNGRSVDVRADGDALQVTSNAPERELDLDLDEAVLTAPPLSPPPLSAATLEPSVDAFPAQSAEPADPGAEPRAVKPKGKGKDPVSRRLRMQRLLAMQTQASKPGDEGTRRDADDRAPEPTVLPVPAVVEPATSPELVGAVVTASVLANRDSPEAYLQPDMAAELAVELADVVYALEVEPEVRFVYVSRSIQALLGYPPEELYADVELGMRMVDRRDRDILRQVMSEASQEAVTFSVRLLTRDGALVWTEHRARAITYADGQVVIYGAARDVTAQRLAEADLKDERERFQMLSEGSRDVVLRSDAHNDITWASPSVAIALGWAPEDLVGRSLAELIHPDDLNAGLDLQRRLVMDGQESAVGEARFVTPTGEWRWMRVTGHVIRDASGKLEGSIGELHDIQSEMAMRAELEREVDHDALTGLAKRGLTLARVQAALDRPDRAGLALLCASVDGLVTVNEAFTHTAGDRVLTVVAQRLIEAVGDIDKLGRIAGGEFLIIVDDVFTADEAGARAAALLTAVRGPVSIGPHEIEVTLSIGVAMPDGNDAAELVRDATTAMRQASAKGHDRWEFLDAERAHAARRRLAVQTELRQALNEDRIKPWYQPVVNLADNTVVGFEALARWERADGAILEPSQFFDAAERSYMITTLDRIILREALEALVHVDPSLVISSNVSAATLSDGGFFDYVASELQRTDIAATRLNLEVTETSLVDVSEAVKAGMRDLAKIGVTWWVDDFGTGYSSISHLRDLPVGGLKLDRSFTVGVASGDQRSIRVSQGLAGLSRGLALQMIAEGVQGERDAAILLGQGWTMAQGWYFGRAAREMSTVLDSAAHAEA